MGRRLALAALALCGCHPCPELPVAEPTAPITTLAELDEQFAALDCSKLVLCGWVSASGEAACLADARRFHRRSAVPRSYLPLVHDAILAGRLGFDPVGMASCIDATRAAGCDPRSLVLARTRCNEALRPLVPPGSPCRDHLECVGGFCSGAASPRICAGICTAFVALGAPCDPDVRACTPDAYCDITTKVCTARPREGESCARATCVDGLFCRQPMGDQPPRCGPPAKEGEACGGPPGTCAGDCDTGLFCYKGGFGQTATCERLGCVGISCVPCSCGGGLQCTPEGCRPPLQLDDLCDLEHQCPDDLLCDSSTGRCAPRPPLFVEGAACAMPVPSPDHYCDGTTHLVTARLPPGSACTPPGDRCAEQPCFASSCDPITLTCELPLCSTPPCPQ